MQRLLSLDQQKQQETESKKNEAVLRIQCKVRQRQAAMKYHDARQEAEIKSRSKYVNVSRGGLLTSLVYVK